MADQKKERGSPRFMVRVPAPLLRRFEQRARDERTTRGKLAREAFRKLLDEPVGKTR
jgi:metal-responsive CopG/Arc/MetJ family transcriptional regulator